MNPRFEIPDDGGEQPIAAPTKVDPADSNFSWDYISKVLKPLGMIPIIVEDNPPDWGDSRTLGERLCERIGNLASFDSIKYATPVAYCFYAGQKTLAEALMVLRSLLEDEALLSRTKIVYADCESQVWRTFHPTANQ